MTDVIQNRQSYKFPEDFIEPFKTQRPDMSVPAYVIYLRTYAAEIDGRMEEWWETCRRVVEGAFSFLRWHEVENGLTLNWKHWDRWARIMFERMFAMKWIPSGRGLQHMGRDVVWIKGGAVLNSCAFTSTKDIDENPTEAFDFLMDMSMLGVGVGFDTEGEGKLTIYPPRISPRTYVVEDTREGWLKLKTLIINAFAGEGNLPNRIDFNQVRLEGTPLKTMGGLASGPGPLIRMVWDLFEVLAPTDWGYTLDENEGILIINCENEWSDFKRNQAKYKVSSLDIGDIMNVEGKCVVSGGIRRSAEIGISRIDDWKFRHGKSQKVGLSDRWIETHKERYGFSPETRNDAWRWAANNSHVIDEPLTKARAREIAACVGEYGDPGIFNRGLVRKTGRLLDGRDDRDFMIEGCNPCIPEDQWIDTDLGPRQVRDLIGKSFNARVGECYYPSSGFWSSGTKPVFKIELKDGTTFRATGNHRFLTDSGWKTVAALKGEDLALSLNLSQSWCGRGSFDEGWLLGEFVGDGHWNNADESACVEFWGPHRKDMADKAVETCRKLYLTRSDFRGSEVSEREKMHVQCRGLTRAVDDWNLINKNLTASDVEEGSSDFCKGFLRGWFDADGCVQGDQSHGVSIRLWSIDNDNLQVAKRMLERLGVRSRIYKRHERGMKFLPNGRGGRKEYEVKPGYELVISNKSLRTFSFEVGFYEPSKQSLLNQLLTQYKRALNRDHVTSEVISVEYVGDLPVYDCTVEEVHEFVQNGVRSHNCGEQPLEDKELCNLVETAPRRHENMDDFMTTCLCALIYGKIVSLIPTHREDTNRVIRKNRRIGVSQTGVFRTIQKIGLADYIEWCDYAYKTMRALDRAISAEWEVNESVRITSLKPAGTGSKVLDEDSGMRAPEAPFYLLRVQFDKTQKIIEPLRAAGYPVLQSVQSPQAVVIEFPIASGCDRTVADIDAETQLQLIEVIQTYWSDNMVSNTVQFKESEKPLLAGLIHEYGNKLKSLSFLCYDGHKYEQAPYEACSQQEYENRISVIGPIDFSTLGAYGTHDQDDKFCQGIACEVKLA